MMTWIFIFFIVLILIFIFVYNVINQNENKALFYPSNRKHWKPKIPYENLYLNINNSEVCHSKKDKKYGESYIHCWYFNNFKNRKTICFFHGTSGNITNRKYIIDLCNKFKYNLFLFDYSGYGESSDFPHKFFLRENGETVYNYLSKKIKSKDIIIWTESLGCITGSYIASKYECGGLILLSGFSSLDDILNYSLEGYKQKASQLLTGLLSYKMDYLPVKDYLYKVECPVVIIHSKEDEIIPYKCAKINYENIKHKNKLFVKICGIHSAPKIKTKQLRKILDFIDLQHSHINSDSLSYILKGIETFAKKHNNFIYSH
jgi:pimeloyl-ACP methyl ester carboxylesterase